MHDKFSERRNSIHTRVEGWYDQFENAPEFTLLSETQRKKAPAIINFFAEYSYSHLGLRPEAWDCAGVEECCAEIMPRKVSAEHTFFEAVSPVLTAFFHFLGDKSLLAHGHDLASSAAWVNSQVVQNSQDSTRWGPAKSFVMGAIAHGIDINDPAALNAYCNATNKGLPRQFAVEPTSWSASTSQASDRAQAQRRVDRYDPCPCGSGKKFKFCCEARSRAAR